ncbi:hypothetical protein BEN74_11020 [Acinetobacter sp. WCHAc010034]|nr:hypothetical protein BEN74_11020 [Acinetobacter sp. WCHAc010034]
MAQPESRGSLSVKKPRHPARAFSDSFQRYSSCRTVRIQRLQAYDYCFALLRHPASVWPNIKAVPHS